MFTAHSTARVPPDRPCPPSVGGAQLVLTPYFNPAGCDGRTSRLREDTGKGGEFRRIRRRDLHIGACRTRTSSSRPTEKSSSGRHAGRRRACSRRLSFSRSASSRRYRRPWPRSQPRNGKFLYVPMREHDMAGKTRRQGQQIGDRFRAPGVVQTGPRPRAAGPDMGNAAP